MENVKKNLLLFFEEHKKESFLVKELSEHFHMVSSHDFRLLVKALAELEEENELILTDKGRFALRNVSQDYVGIYRSNEKGFGFVTIEELQQDIYIPKGHTLFAMDGDVVRVQITKEEDKIRQLGAQGSIIDIKERKTSRVVGVFQSYSTARVAATQLYGEVKLSDKKLEDYTCFIQTKGIQPVDNTVVVVELTRYPVGQQKELYGHVVKEIGYKDAVGVDVEMVLHKLGIPIDFSSEALEEARQVSLTISEEEQQHRTDLRDVLTITIDGEDAKDLDDAISLTKREDGTYMLSVHIADVSHYVQRHSALDQQASERGTSVYVTDRVVPMLPQRLSNGICSLHPNEDRLTMTCEMEIDQSGTVYQYRIFESLIQSDYRMSYNQVNAIFQGDESLRQQYVAIVDMLEAMKELHFILERRRRQRGAIDFDTHEAKIMVDENGKPTGIQLRARGVSERLIESFMLAANETVAKHFEQLQVPFLYRIHEHPNEEKLQRFLEFITAFGIVVNGKSDEISPKKLQQALDEVKGESYEAVVSTMMLRSMKQAKYDSVPSGHYGLAAKDYTHFTSPIRRYPDLLVHRMIRYYHQNGITLSDEEKERLEWYIQGHAEHSSKMERRAVEAEREVEAMKKAEYMQQYIGETFEGIVSSVTKFGLFVELPNTVEGLIHISHMKQDYFHFIESHLLLLGERTGKAYRIGDRVMVKLTKVDVDSRAIDFSLVEDASFSNSMRPERHESYIKKSKRKKEKRQQGRQAFKKVSKKKR